MEYFNKSKAVKLRSHLGKYLVTDEGNDKLRQSKRGTTKNAIWLVELVEGKSHRVRLRSLHRNGRYLTATDAPFLLGVTGNKLVHSELDLGLDWKYEWEPIREGLIHVKLRSWCGKYLRGNGGTPPWRNSVTHDDPYSSTTHNWILWSVETVEELLLTRNVLEHSSFTQSVVSVSSFDSDYEISAGSEPVSPVAVSSLMQSQNSMLQVRM